MTFAIVNVKTEYSFLDSVVRLEEYLDAAVRLGYETVGICDEGNLHAAFRFVRGARARGLRPVVGFSATFMLRDLPLPLRFIALDTQGYHNLLKLSTRKNEGRSNFDDFRDLLGGLALVLPAGYESAARELEAYVGLGFGETSDYARLLALPSVRYLTVDDATTLEILHAVRDGVTFDENLMVESAELLQRPETYESYYRERQPAALEGLTTLLREVHYDLEEHLELPHFDKTRDAAELLRETAETGLRELVLSDGSPAEELQTEKPLEIPQSVGSLESLSLAEVYRSRLSHELAVIHQMGFDDYFLIVADLLRYARENQIYCGMGRGSAAGSLVAYALQITHVDPVANRLLFERFLNPERVAMPDIDIDMPDDRRSELLAYMRNRYGSDHVAQIVTFSTFGKRQALRDVGKAFGMTEPEVNGLTKGISRFGSLNEEYTRNQRFKAEILRDGRLQRVFEVAKRIEGMPRQTSTHASGVVLSEEPLYHYVPLKPGEDLALTQFEAPDVEGIGLLKIDFLGLRNLTLVADLRALVRDRYKADTAPLSINLEDEETLALFRAGNTMGIFQFENPQMRRFLRNLAPTKFDDIVDATSIFRPGPSQFIPQFIARRHGKEAVPPVDASIADILAPTYGIMIYQEQVMLVAVEFAGFSMGRADSLRRAISKKKGAEFEKLKAEFISGSVAKGHSQELAEQIYDLIERFANYGFNRSHAYAYAALAFQISYFKAHYPDAFYETHLRGYKREVMLADALDNGYGLVAPTINTMPYHDKVTDGKVALGLSHIKGFPREYALWIIENRPFKDLSDFVKRSPLQWQREDTIRPLLSIGAFDALDGENRGKLLFNLARLIDYNQNIQLDLFGKSSLSFSYEPADDLTAAEKYDEERELLGVAITAHPLNDWAKKLEGHFTRLSDLTEKQTVTVLTEITSIRSLTTRKSERMAFVEVSDTVQNLTVVLFPEAYRANLTELEQGGIYLISGRTELRDDSVQLQATRFTRLYETEEKLWLSVADASNNSRIAAILTRFPGPHPVVLHDVASKKTSQTTRYVVKSEALLKALTGLVQSFVYR